MSLRIPLLLLTLACARSYGATAIGINQPADVVLGQIDFNSKLAPATPDAASMNTPTSVAADPTTGKVFVADKNNNRVLRFTSAAAMITGSPAEAFFGQSSASSNGAATTQKELSGPISVVVDLNGTLWVADTNNNRVLRFNNAATKPAVAINADGVLGQPNFGTKTVLTPPTQASLSSPRAVAVDASGTLWVADAGNNRVLRFDGAASLADGANASGVLGAPSFTLNFGGATTQYAMIIPYGLATDSTGHLWVADSGNNRVLRFDGAASLPNGALASGVLGQPDFLTKTPLNPPTAAGLNIPIGVATDSAGALWVCDFGNSRLLRFDGATNKPNNAAANSVLGQADFITKNQNTTQAGIALALGASLDASGGLWVADTSNHRVLHYTPQTIPPAAVALVVKGKKRILTTRRVAIIRGIASSADGIARVQYRVAKRGGFRPAAGTTTWRFRAKLKPGRNRITIRAVGNTGNLSTRAIIVKRG